MFSWKRLAFSLCWLCYNAKKTGNFNLFLVCFHTIPVTALGWLGRFAGWMAGLVGCDGWSTGLLAGCLGWLAGWLAGWLDGWMGWLAGWMTGWFAAWLAGPISPNNWIT
jgi:hypothetical protein